MWTANCTAAVTVVCVCGGVFFLGGGGQGTESVLYQVCGQLADCAAAMTGNRRKDKWEGMIMSCNETGV